MPWYFSPDSVLLRRMLLEKCFTYRLLGMGATAELGVFVVVLENSPSQDFRQEI